MKRCTPRRAVAGLMWCSAGLLLGTALLAGKSVSAAAAGTIAMPPAARVAGPLPRVFFTPAERARISAARLAGRPLPATAAPAEGGARVDVPASAAATTTNPGEPAGTPASAPLRSARVDGLTLGHGSAAAVWIGGERITDGGRWGRWRVQVRRDGARLRAADGTVREVRVGMELMP